MTSSSCPACANSRDLAFVEERRDPIGGVVYTLRRCQNCGLIFSDPRDPVGPDWYEKSAPLRAVEARGNPHDDSRFTWFFSSDLFPGRLLDLGCGDGGFLSEAVTCGWKAVGVDYESRMIALAREKGLDAHAQDFETFLKGRAAKEFDVVTLFDVLEHTGEPREMLTMIKPVLKRGGHLAITFPNANRPAWFGRESFDYPPHHFTRWTPAALKNFLEREGFSVVEMKTPGPSVRWFSEVIFHGVISPAAIGLVKRILFGRQTHGSLTSLYEASPATDSPSVQGPIKKYLAEPDRRRVAANVFRYAARFLTYPIGAVLVLACRLRRGSGEYLYCLARFEPKS